jgi:hypothetical protein
MPDHSQEVKDELGLGNRSEVSTHVLRYRYHRDEVELLIDYGTET